MKIRTTVAAAILIAQSAPAAGAELTVLSAGGIRPPLEQLIPQFERASGHKVAIKFVGGPAVKQAVDGGAAFDVAISTANVIDDLVKAGKIVAATRAEIARAGVGVGVRTGAPKPDISTVDAFKRTLLNAKSVAYAKDGTAGMHFQGVLQRLGIAKDMEPKLKPTVAADPKAGVIPLVARGDAEIGIAATAALFGPGVDFVGPLPPELQSYSRFTAGVGTGAKEGAAAVAFLRFLTASSADPAFKAKGMEPAPRR